MKVIGIICEYNPLHNGHIYQISEIKKKFSDSLIIVITSSSFTQRGELSIINKFRENALIIGIRDKEFWGMDLEELSQEISAYKKRKKQERKEFNKKRRKKIQLIFLTL